MYFVCMKTIISYRWSWENPYQKELEKWGFTSDVIWNYLGDGDEEDLTKAEPNKDDLWFDDEKWKDRLMDHFTRLSDTDFGLLMQTCMDIQGGIYNEYPEIPLIPNVKRNEVTQNYPFEIPAKLDEYKETVANFLMSFQYVGINWLPWAEFNGDDHLSISFDKDWPEATAYYRWGKALDYILKNTKRYELKYENQAVVEYKNGEVHQVISKVTDKNKAKQKLYDFVFGKPNQKLTYATLQHVVGEELDIQNELKNSFKNSEHKDLLKIYFPPQKGRYIIFNSTR